MTKSDARGVTTTYGVDDLNRVAAKQYSDGTPAVTSCFDGDQKAHTVSRGAGALAKTVSWTCVGAPAGTYVKTRLTQVSTAASSSVSGTATTVQFPNYDALGRVLASSSTINGAASYNFSAYSYNLAGVLTGMTYPSGHQISYGLDSVGRPVSVSNPSTSYTYAQNATFWPSGALNTIGLGFTNTTAAFTETHTYDSRLRQTGVTVAGL